MMLLLPNITKNQEMKKRRILSCANSINLGSILHKFAGFLLILARMKKSWRWSHGWTSWRRSRNLAAPRRRRMPRKTPSCRSGAVDTWVCREGLIGWRMLADYDFEFRVSAKSSWHCWCDISICMMLTACFTQRSKSDVVRTRRLLWAPRSRRNSKSCKAILSGSRNQGPRGPIHDFPTQIAILRYLLRLHKENAIRTSDHQIVLLAKLCQWFRLFAAHSCNLSRPSFHWSHRHFRRCLLEVRLKSTRPSCELSSATATRTSKRIQICRRWKAALPPSKSAAD